MYLCLYMQLRVLQSNSEDVQLPQLWLNKLQCSVGELKRLSIHSNEMTSLTQELPRSKESFK